MQTLKYKLIKTDAQYEKYCEMLETFLEGSRKSKAIQDEIELLTLLIEKYDQEHSPFMDADPVQLLKAMMKENKLKAVDLAGLLGVSEGLVSDMINYKKGFSKETIRILSERFRLSQEAFNRPYELKTTRLNGKSRTKRLLGKTKRARLTQ